MSDGAVVLVVEDEPDIADLYAAYLADRYEVRTAYTGAEALELLTPAVDVVLLDRRLVEWSGDELVTVVQDRQIDCQVAMVTAVEPDFDIVDLAIDAYLQKPVTRASVRETVEELLLRRDSPVDAQELLALVSRRHAIEAEKTPAELAASDQYAKLEQRIAYAEAQLDVRAGQSGSKYRPVKCSECEMRWDITVGDAVGFIRLSSFIWKCTRCGNVEKRTDPHDRRVARR